MGTPGAEDSAEDSGVWKSRRGMRHWKKQNSERGWLNGWELPRSCLSPLHKAECGRQVLATTTTLSLFLSSRSIVVVAFQIAQLIVLPSINAWKIPKKKSINLRD